MDIAPVSEIVTIPGVGEMPIYGLGAISIVKILRAHPEYKKVIEGDYIKPPMLPNGDPDRDKIVDWMQSDDGMLVITTMPAIIAGGFGLAGDAEAEFKISTLSFELQMDLYSRVMKMTNPGNTPQNPFPKEEIAGFVVSGKEPDMILPLA